MMNSIRWSIRSSCQFVCSSQETSQGKVHSSISIWKKLTMEETLQRLENHNEKPSMEDFRWLLQKCRKIKDLESARRVHLCIQGVPAEAYNCLGNYIVPMFVDCGSMFDAEWAFGKLPFPNVHSWTALIVGSILDGEIPKAFELYRRMQENGVCPSSQTLVALVKPCNQIKDVWRIHDEVVRKGFETDLFVGSTLIDTYMKCNSLTEAQRLFNSLSLRNVVIWNTLITGYIKHGCCDEVIHCVDKMQLELISPDDATFVVVLKACSAVRDIENGKNVHTEILVRGLEREISIGNTLIDMYSKCGCISEAQFMFENLSMRTVVSWNALIGGYIDHNFDQAALECFDQMQRDGCAHNCVTFVCVSKACANAAARDKGKEFHKEMILRGYERDIVLCSALVDMYTKVGFLAEAWKISCELPFRDVIVWNTLIAGYAEHGPGVMALECVDKMQLEGISPNDVTFTSVLKGCLTFGALDMGQILHTQIMMMGYEKDVFVGSSLLDMYAKHGSLMEAEVVFDKLQSRNIVSWTALIAGYVEHGFNQEALSRFYQAECEGISPNKVMFISALAACDNAGCIEQGRNLHTGIVEKGFDDEVVISNSLINIYAKCCSLAEALKVFQTIPSRTIGSWNAMIKGYGINDEGKLALQLFRQMLHHKVKPNDVTYTCILNACSHASLVSEGQTIFEQLNEGGGDIPCIETYGCIVDLLARSGNLHEAEKFLKTMPSSPSVEMWFALFSACKNHEDAEVGNRCFEQLLDMDPEFANSRLSVSR